MASRPAGPLVLDVVFEPRDDGGLRAYCDKVPNFVLSHRNAEAVMADVIPALEVILSEMYGMPVKVSKAETVGVEPLSLPEAYICGSAQYVGIRANH